MKIQKCKCKNAGQDAIHGEGNRVFNPTKKKPDGNGGFRCTSCGVIHRA